VHQRYVASKLVQVVEIADRRRAKRIVRERKARGRRNRERLQEVPPRHCQSCSPEKEQARKGRSG
jgi:hypothetical protein